MNTLNLIYNVNTPTIHFIVKAGQNIDITEPGTYNMVPIDLESLIGGASQNINKASSRLFDSIDNYSNLIGGNQDNFNTTTSSESKPLDTNDESIIGGGLHGKYFDSGLVNDYTSYNDNMKTSEDSVIMSVVDMCRNTKNDNRYPPLTKANKVQLFTDNLADLVHGMNRNF